MNDAYTSALFDVVKDTSVKYGYDLPKPIEAYVVMLLATHVDRPDFLPKDAFGTTLLQLKSSAEAKELGDTCLFVAGVFPTIGERKGLKRRYYQDIGSTSYEMASDMNIDLFPVLARHFVFLSNFIEVITHSTKYKQNSLFR